jgi:hypothetical protein
MTYPGKNSLTFSVIRNIVRHTQGGNKPTLTGAKTMTVSAIASSIYQAAKSAGKGVWNWRMEWSKAMKQAWRKVMNTIKTANDIKDVITYDKAARGNRSLAPMHPEKLNQEVCCTVGSVLVAGDKTEIVKEIAHIGNAYSLEVRAESGAKIAMSTLCELVEKGAISIWNCAK